MNEICRSDAAYVMGALSPADRREYEEHLQGCADCQTAVQRLAGLPGLLALTSEQAVRDPSPTVPDTLLPLLVARVSAARRRRRWASAGLLAAAVAAVVAVSAVLVINRTAGEAEEYVAAGQPAGAAAGTTSAGSQSSSAVPDERTPMTQVVPGPMTASLELVDKKWGTAITVICSYQDGTKSTVAYDLTVLDIDGHLGSAGTWRAVPGSTARVTAATSVPRNRIEALEVRLPDGSTILRSTP